MAGPAQHSRSALIVAVPAAEPIVGRWRARHDPVARRGVPAHVTLLFPFRAPDRLSELIAPLGRLFATMPSFAAEFRSVGQFTGVTWLAPEPSAPFGELTRRLVSSFPDCPPYGGRIADPVPHLTVADVSGDGEAGLADHGRLHAEIVADIHPHLPVLEYVREARLLVEDGEGWWSTHTVFPLAGSNGGEPPGTADGAADDVVDADSPGPGRA